MAGTKAGAKRAAETNKLRHGPDFFKKIGAESWKNPERSRLTGFALKSPEERSELGRKGGKKTKNEYKTKEDDKKTPDVPEETSISPSPC